LLRKYTHSIAVEKYAIMSVIYPLIKTGLIKFSTIMSRGIKQFFVICTYFVITILLGVMIYYSFIKAPETCFDGKQNQNEQAMDCGGVCQLACKEIVTGEEIQFQETAFIRSGENRYDILGKIHNPNSEVGATSFTYTASLLDSAEKVLATHSGTGYILPLETKYILDFNLDISVAPTTVSIHLSDVQWVRFSGYQEKPAVSIYQKRYDQISSGTGFSEVFGLLSNESSYDFRSLIVQIILRDSTGKPLALNSTEMNTVRSHENRDFRLVWPSAFPGAVENVEMVVDADVYHSENFIRQYLPGGKFQDITPARGY